jgi:hypothetical protein
MTTITATASSNRALLTIGLAIPAILSVGSAAQAQPLQTTIAASKPIVVTKPVATPLQINQLNTFGCPACRSGLDSRFNDKQPIVNPAQVNIGVVRR